jgi:phage nucleotide-binding protein
MAIKLKSTREVSLSSGIKILVHGQSGSGKTTLIKTLPRPIVLSAEAGLLSLSNEDIPYIEIHNLDELGEAYEYLLTAEAREQFQSVALDSISEIAEVVLSYEKKMAKDPRQAYGATQDQMADLIRSFRDLDGYNVYFSAKSEKDKDETGRMLWSPMMPGNKMGQALPYFFDEVFALRVEKGDDGAVVRAIQTDGDGEWTAKDRSGRLDMWEEPDLGAIIAKIRGEEAANG